MPGTDPTLLERLVSLFNHSLPPLVLGALTGALWKALRRPARSLLRIVLEFVATAGIGTMFGGITAGLIVKMFDAPVAYSAAAAAATCAVAADRVLRLAEAKLLGDDRDKSDRRSSGGK